MATGTVKSSGATGDSTDDSAMEVFNHDSEAYDDDEYMAMNQEEYFQRFGGSGFMSPEIPLQHSSQSQGLEGTDEEVNSEVAKTPTLPNGIILMVFCKRLLNTRRRILVMAAMMMAAL